MAKQPTDLMPFARDEIESLRAEWTELPAQDARRRLLATLDQTRMEMDVLRRLMADEPQLQQG